MLNRLDSYSSLTKDQQIQARDAIFEIENQRPSYLGRVFSDDCLEFSTSNEMFRCRRYYVGGSSKKGILAGIVDYRQAEYRELGSRLFVNPKVNESLLYEMLDLILQKLEALEINKIATNTLSNGGISTVLESFGFVSTDKIERISCLANYEKFDLDGLNKEGFTFQLISKSKKSLSSYADLLNDFYGVNCIDLSWIRQFHCFDQKPNEKSSLLCSVKNRDGEMIGFSTGSLRSANARMLFQENTYVVNKYRGFGLGYQLKKYFISQVFLHFPKCQSIIAHHDIHNGAMTRISKTMGYNDLTNYRKYRLGL